MFSGSSTMLRLAPANQSERFVPSSFGANAN